MAENSKFSEAQEAARALAGDYQEVFGTVAGKRVLKHIIDVLLYGRQTMKGQMNPNGTFRELNLSDAMYLTARRDASIELQKIMEYDPTQATKPVVATRRPYPGRP